MRPCRKALKETKMPDTVYILRVVYKNEKIEIHEYKNKKQAMRERDKYRLIETVESAKIID
jgi:hypothetical protein